MNPVLKMIKILGALGTWGAHVNNELQWTEGLLTYGLAVKTTFSSVIQAHSHSGNITCGE